MFNSFLQLSRFKKRAISLFVDFVALSFALWASFALRLMGGVGDLVWNLNPRPLAADKAGTDLKSVPKSAPKQGQTSSLSLAGF
jgi:nitrate reductase NapE component